MANFEAVLYMEDDNMAVYEEMYPEGYSVDLLHVRWFIGELFICDDYGYPSEKFSINKKIINELWRIEKLPEYTFCGLDLALEYKRKGGNIALLKEVDSFIEYIDITSTSTIDFENLAYGGWAIKNW